ncbi:DUF1905 domain-containing protein [Deinococcus koreensis]|uniref:DUF1905 domain-containing protein n=1 Tax=Deinococcus koreensis TaxID=2054903 RepID=A0A2K3UVB4_9DEIO|nr:DUF1905 domain-containing protein [Deinococcus koreensis]PNY80468.1 DUF1905 domain-containing protein [Deinococcus koreensis]
MTLEFSGPVWQWRGPAPFYFVTVPDEQSQAIKAAAKLLTYGWGMIPVTARIGETEWTTSMFEKDRRYVLPLKVMVRRAEGLDEDDTVTVQLDLG